MAEPTPPPPPHKCAHASCDCTVPAGTKFCSDYCRSAPETELHCNCRHPGCHI